MRFLPQALILGTLGLGALAAPAAAQNAGATGWTLISVDGHAAEEGGRLAFSADGAIFGTTGCNRFQGTVSSAPGLVTFNAPFAVTRMACIDTMAEQEEKVLEALTGTVAVAYDPVSDLMSLIPESGAAVLGFAREAE
ncbi:MAG: META domain-containing protein [Maritimibacter sp.]|nr:META domain-containing protein [Maritimibacter sp.]